LTRLVDHVHPPFSFLLPVFRFRRRHGPGDLFDDDPHKVRVGFSPDPQPVVANVDEDDIDVERGQPARHVQLGDLLGQHGALVVREGGGVAEDAPERHLDRFPTCSKIKLCEETDGG